MNKYRNKKVRIGNEVYDSQKEYDRFCELKWFEKAHLISDLKRQVPFELIPAQYESYDRYGKDGKKLKEGQRCIEKSCVYNADFTYYNANGDYVVEDVKSEATRTPEYIIKRKLMLYLKGIKIKEVEQ